MRAFAAVLALLYLLSVVVQVNDPDPIQWMALYAAAFLVSAWRTTVKPVPVWAPLVVLGVAVGWGILILPGALGETTFSEMFGTIGMKNEAAEVGREVLGLGIVAFGMAVIALRRGAPATRGR